MFSPPSIQDEGISYVYFRISQEVYVIENNKVNFLKNGRAIKIVPPSFYEPGVEPLGSYQVNRQEKDGIISFNLRKNRIVKFKSSLMVEGG